MEDNTKLKNQVCFKVYSLSREIINHYRSFLNNLGITYPQYLVFKVLWENEPQSVNEIGKKLSLDSGTLTPLLKRLEKKEFIIRQRKKTDERIVEILLTEKGNQLKDQVSEISKNVGKSMGLEDDDLLELKIAVDNVLDKIKK